jgi:tetratricopeptide (TPR) repeat protein
MSDRYRELMDAGFKYIETRDFEKAKECFQQAVKMNETDDISNHWLGTTLGKLGESEPALVYLNRAIENSDDVQVKAQSWLGIAGVFNDLGRKNEAIEAAVKAYALDRDDPYKAQFLGMLMDPDIIFSFGPPEKTAPKRLKVREKRSPPVHLTLITEASQALDERNMEQFENLINKAQELAPDDPLCHIGLSVVKEMKGDLHGAAKELVEAGLLYMKEKRLDDANKSFLNATHHRKRNPEAWFNIGLIQREWGELDDAVKAFKKSLTGRRNDPKTHLQLGIALYDLIEFDDAEKSMKRSIELDSTAESWLHLGSIQAAKGEHHDVLYSLEEADRLSERGEKRVFFALGLSNLLLGQDEDARNRFREWVETTTELVKRTNRRIGHVLRMDINQPKVWLTLDEICEELGSRWERDLTLKVATQMVPDSAQVWYRFSKVAIDRRVRDSAQDQAYCLDSDDPDIKFAEARSFYDIGMKKEALDLFYEVLEIKPDHQNAEKWVSYIEEDFAELEKLGHSPHLGFYGYYVEDEGPYQDEWERGEA